MATRQFQTAKVVLLATKREEILWLKRCGHISSGMALSSHHTTEKIEKEGF
ncbi:hypothetical protein [Prevotella aurantiaca]|uniref:hypothetical protein n=1 Tax=Prevotella aurantiaca TaxID=596085 RepID=UPI00288BDC26|nr:hypothetical protein [Prevotella aurantiaca]